MSREIPEDDNGFINVPMSFPLIFNIYARYIGYALTFILPIAIFVSLTIIEFNVDIITSITPNSHIFILWIIYVANGVILGLNSLIAILAFEFHVHKLSKDNTMPIESSEGFRNIERNYKRKNLLVFVALFLAILSFLLFITCAWESDNIAINVLKDPSKENAIATLLLYLTMSGIIFSLAASIVIPIPKLASFKVGSLIDYYSPKRHPTILRFLVYDGIYNLLDPITRVSFIKWKRNIERHILDDFAPKLNNEDKEERPKLAIQNILTLIYLNQRFPNFIDKETLWREVCRIIDKNAAKEYIYNGEFSIKVWKGIFKHLKKEIDDLFLIIDRIILTITHTPALLDEKAFWITSAIPPTQIQERAENLIFLVLNRKDPNRFYSESANAAEVRDEDLTFEFYGADDLSPHDFSLKFKVRRYDEFVKLEKTYSLAASDPIEKHKIVRQVTGILYQSTGIWLTLHSNNLGANLSTIKFLHEGKPIHTMNFDLTVVRGVDYYLRNWGPKILTSLGFLLPLIRAIIGF